MYSVFENLVGLPADICPRAHQKEDWKPYVCLWEDCSRDAEDDRKPVPSFEQYHDWQRHMEMHAMDWSCEIYKSPTWVCSADIDPETGRRKPNYFTIEADFIEHLKKEHPKYTPERISSLAQHSIVFMERDANICPLCCFSVDEDECGAKPETGVGTTGQTSVPSSSSAAKRKLEDIAEEDEEGGNSQEMSAEALQAHRMARHVSNHLHTLTFLVLRLLSLPKTVEGDDDELQNPVSIDPDGTGTSEVVKSDYQDLFVEENETPTPPAPEKDTPSGKERAFPLVSCTPTATLTST